MSTVQSILNNLGFEVDDPAGTKMYAVINLAIRSISKRLYLLNSDLAVAALDVDIYAADTVSADDISFADADPDTIKSVVEDLSVFNVGQYLTVTGDSDNNGTYQISKTTAPANDNLVTPFAGTITLESDEELTTEAAGDDVVLTSLAGYADLPSDFWGLRPDRGTGKSEIYISGNTWLLSPSPGASNEIQYTSAGEPRWFRIIGTKLWVFPPTSSDITISGMYFQRPTAITATTDTMPYSEMFDDAITAAAMRWRNGSLDGPSLGILEGLMWDAVDSIVSKSEGFGPPQMPTGVDWGAF